MLALSNMFEEWTQQDMHIEPCSTTTEGPANRPFAFESNRALRFKFELNLESNRP